MVKLALDEWRLPFLLWTEHKNLEYITAQLTSARWALVFTRFNFSLSYSPGTKNGKLFRQFSTNEEQEGGPERILPPP